MLVVCPALWVEAVPAAAPAKRVVDLEVTIPERATPRVMAHEDEGAAVKLPNGKRFGFVPTIREMDGLIVTLVSIWDADSRPQRKLGGVEVQVGGATARSQTTPAFGVRLLRVINAK